MTGSVLDHRDGRVAVMVVHAPGHGLSDWFRNKSGKILLLLFFFFLVELMGRVSLYSQILDLEKGDPGSCQKMKEENESMQS